MSLPSAARGVTNVIERCEGAKNNQYLDLSSSCLLFIADAIYLVLKGYEVTKVNLRDNCLKNFPKKMVAKFPDMTVMTCDHNQIGELPDELSEWTKMRGLNAAYNKLTVFPSALFSMKELAILDLSHNQIEEIDVPKLYESFPKLVQANFAGNKLSQETRQQLLDQKPDTLKLLL